MIDPNKLSALVEEQAANPLGDLPMPEEDGEEETEAEGNLAERGEELLTSMGEFGTDLRESADIMLDNAIELGEDAISEEPAPETEDLAMDIADRLPPFMQEGMTEHLAEKPEADLKAVGAALDASLDSDASPEGEYTDEVAAQVGGMLKLVASCCGEPSDDEDEDGAGDEDDEGEAPTEDLPPELPE